MTEPRDPYVSPVLRAARELKESPAVRAARSMQNSPVFRQARQAQAIAAQAAEREKETRRTLEELTERQAQQRRAKVERERITAESTAAVASWAMEQAEENHRLRILTNVLAFAVIYDVVNGSFDDHTWWTTVISAVVGVAVLGVALVLGKWRRRQQAAKTMFLGPRGR